MRRIGAVVLLAGCGGDDETTTPSCDPLVTTPFAEVPAPEWDPALPAGLDDYRALAGSWTVGTDCPIGTTTVNLTPLPEESIAIVEQGQDPAAACGCVDDPDHGPDPQYAPIAVFDGLTVFVAAWDDPGVENRSVTATGALFPDDAPFRLRACGSANIDPATNSLHDSYSVTLRVTNGEPSGVITLKTDTGEVETCTLRNWTKVGR